MAPALPPSAAGIETSLDAITNEERGIAPPRAATTKHKKRVGANVKPLDTVPAANAKPSSDAVPTPKQSAPTMKETEYGF